MGALLLELKRDDGRPPSGSFALVPGWPTLWLPGYLNGVPFFCRPSSLLRMPTGGDSGFVVVDPSWAG
eukprot:12772813-Alexandrium_andersonii.AAC.1